MDPVLQEAPERHSEPSVGLLDGSWRHFGHVLGALGGSGARRGRSQALLEASWKRPGTSWGHVRGALGALGAIQVAWRPPLEVSWKPFGSSWGGFGSMLRAPEVVLSASRELLAAFCCLVEFHCFSMVFIVFQCFPVIFQVWGAKVGLS